VTVLGRAARVLVALVVVALTLGVGASRAEAHAQLLSTSPADRAILDAPPSEVVLHFNEPVRFFDDTLRVFDSGGARVDVGTPDADGADILIALRDGLADGSYVAAWRVVSADGHPIAGAFVFSVGVDEGLDADAVLAIAGSSGNGRWSDAAGVLRWLTYAGALLALGVAVFGLVVDAGDAARRQLVLLVGVGGALAALASLAALPVEAALVTGRGSDALTDDVALRDVLGTNFGDAVVWRVAGCALLVLATTLVGTRRTVVTVVAGVAVLVGFVITGHTAVTDPRWLVVLADLAHLAAAATWIGGLVALALVMRARRAEGDAMGATQAVRGFSTLAGISIVVLLVAGTARAWTETRSIDALTDTRYGKLLLVKVVLAVVVITIGAYNNRRLVPAVADRSSERAMRRLSTTVRVEVLVLAVVLALTAALVATVPAREAVAGSALFTQSVPFGDLQLDVTVEPARVGLNEIHVYTLDAGGRPAEPPGDPVVELRNRAAEVGPISRTPTRAGPGHWTLSGPEMSIPGEWQLTVIVRVDEFTEQRAVIDVPVS
jgi:copper transport protein